MVVPTSIRKGRGNVGSSLCSHPTTPIYKRSQIFEELSFSGNVSLHDPKQFSYRNAYFLDLPAIAATVYSSVDPESSTGIFGLCYFPPILLLQFPPTAWMVYYSPSDISQDLPDGVSASVQGAASFICTIFSRIDEVDGNGNVNKSTLFGDLNWSKGTYQNDTTGQLSWITFTSSGNPFTVYITFAVSKVVGKLNPGGSTLTPQNMETIIELEGYQYANQNHHLNLVLYIAAAASQVANAFTNTQTLIAGNGDSEAYLKFSNQATVDGKTVNVDVSGYADQNVDLSESGNSYIQDQLKTNSNLQVTSRLVTISFPAGASSIFYDPSMGFSAPNSSVFVIPTAFSLTLVLISLLL